MNDLLTPQGWFDFASNAFLRHEGGFSNNPKDPGGATNYGITQRELTRCYSRLKLPATLTDTNFSNTSLIIISGSYLI